MCSSIHACTAHPSHKTHPPTQRWHVPPTAPPARAPVPAPSVPLATPCSQAAFAVCGCWLCALRVCCSPALNASPVIHCMCFDAQSNTSMVHIPGMRGLFCPAMRLPIQHHPHSNWALLNAGLPCPANCTGCTSSTTCTQCAAGFSLQPNGSCGVWRTTVCAARQFNLCSLSVFEPCTPPSLAYFPPTQTVQLLLPTPNPQRTLYRSRGLSCQLYQLHEHGHLHPVYCRFHSEGQRLVQCVTTHDTARCAQDHMCLVFFFAHNLPCLSGFPHNIQPSINRLPPPT